MSWSQLKQREQNAYITHILLQDILLKKGIAILRFDFYAHGESDGKIENRTIEEFTEEIMEAIKFVKERKYTKIGLCGTSIGGVASVIAASKSQDLKCLALKAVGMGQTSRHMPNYKHNFDNKTWIKAGENINIPTLIIHGAEDKDVEIELGRILAESIKTSKILIYEKADHLFSRTEDYNKLIGDISGFLIEQMQ